MEEIVKLVTSMDPKEASAQLAKGLKSLFPLLGEEARTRFIIELVGESQGDKVSSMVHL